MVLPAPPPRIDDVLTTVQRKLAEFYDFVPTSCISNHVLSREELDSTLCKSSRNKPEYNARAAVWFEQSADDEIFVGVHFDHEIVDRIASQNPLQKLDDTNLDAFSILVEEISHFHLLLNRAATARSVTKVELEWQGEVDKLLVASQLLSEQSGDPHLIPLARRLYDQAQVVSHDRDTYQQATKFAAQYWYSMIDLISSDLGPGRLKASLRQLYRAPWSEKSRACDRALVLAA